VKQIFFIALKEVQDGMRNRWVVLIALAMAAFALILALLGSVPTGMTKISSLAVTVVSLASLSIFFIPLIALLLTYDSIVGEAERGTLILLLSYPVARWQVIVGKFCGALILLSLAIALGYGSAGIAISLTAETAFADQAWSSFAKLLLSSVLLGAAFLSLGFLISTSLRERGTAAAAAIGSWIFFVLLYDMGLLGLLASGAGKTIGTDLVIGLLLANPTDAYRMFNLVGSDETAILSGMAGLSLERQIPAMVPIAVMVAWAALPLCGACAIFQRRQL
jgi:Cu-processing system permease protein